VVCIAVGLQYQALLPIESNADVFGFVEITENSLYGLFVCRVWQRVKLRLVCSDKLTGSMDLHLAQSAASVILEEFGIKVEVGKDADFHKSEVGSTAVSDPL
jgi:hypothetical protein